MIRAEVIADSISPAGHRLTTIEATFPRQILAEVNTHRSHSRNSASSRAVPVRKMLEQVRTDPFIPLRWQRAQPGMQGGDELPKPLAGEALDVWLAARNQAVAHAEALLQLGVHKTMPNRLLEPFAWHTAILTATNDGWANFWAQRCSPLAELHMEATAKAMRAAYNASEPREVGGGEWHLPYINDGWDRFEVYTEADLPRISAARCARVSYLTHDGKRDIHADLNRYKKLVSADPPHWSPLEHPATPADGPVLGNFTGWAQLRHLEAAQ
jgi:hypothetical protein